LKIHDVDAEFIEEMRATGLEELSVDRIVALKIHDFNPEFLQEMWDLGLLQREKTPEAVG
jgi:hypothetical protein